MTPNQAGVTILAASVAAGVVLWASIYYMRHIYRYGPNALTPLEAWLVARKEREALDRELAEITSANK